MKADSKKVLRKYFILCTIFGVLLLLLWGLVWAAVPSLPLRILSLFVLIIPIMPVILMIANKTIAPVLFEELDPQKFQEILNDRRLLPLIGYRMSAALSLGDYQTVVNICVYQLHKKDSIQNKCLCLGTLARVYFELRDFEKLEALCKKYQEYRNLYPKKLIFQTTRAAWSYYESYLSNRYEECESICEEQEQKSKNNKFMKLQNDFYCAVAYYENGEFAAAKERFHNVVIGAPKMHYASIAQKYIEAIESQTEIVLSEKSVLPDHNYAAAASPKIHRRQKNNRILLFIGIAMIATSLIFNYLEYRQQAFEKKQRHEETIIYENKLNAAIAARYDKAKFIEYFGLQKDGSNVEALCLVNHSGSLELVEVVRGEIENTFDIIKIVENIKLDSYYCVKSPVSKYYIGFQIDTAEIHDENAYYITEFKLDRNTYWIRVDYLETIPKKLREKVG